MYWPSSCGLIWAGHVVIINVFEPVNGLQDHQFGHELGAVPVDAKQTRHHKISRWEGAKDTDDEGLIDNLVALGGRLINQRVGCCQKHF